MSESYVNREDVLKQKEWSYDLRQYVVTVKNIQRLKSVKAEHNDPGKHDETEQLQEAARILFNRCAAWTGGAICWTCGLCSLCDKYRSVYQKGSGEDGK